MDELDCTISSWDANLHIEVTGKYNTAKCFVKHTNDSDMEQVMDICNLPFLGDANIRMMPDMHKGKGCMIGTTIRVNGTVVPNFLGVDLNCGMMVAKIPVKDINLAGFDDIVRREIPIGRNIRPYWYGDYGSSVTGKLARRWDGIDDDYTMCSVGTLGGGNHFIEISRSENTGDLYLIIHTGSRKLGYIIATNYQKLAYKTLSQLGYAHVINGLKAAGRQSEIEETLRKLKQSATAIEPETAYLSGQEYSDYIHDVGIAEDYATHNRMAIMIEIFQAMDWYPEEFFETRHNYIDFDPPDGGAPILRKGAVSAKLGQKFIVPLNMRDGSLICIGKGNADWNYSAPHGAGRNFSRTEAKKRITMSDFLGSMDGIYTTSMSEDTIDESAFAYKDSSEIESAIYPTATVIDKLIPIYNLKAGGED